MATSALRAPRNVDHYRDTSLDGLIGNDNRYLRGGTQSRTNSLTSQGRRSASETDSLHMKVVPSPDVARGAPISYRRAPEETAVPQRSFSQRAKARPSLREAIADAELADNTFVDSRRHPDPDQVGNDHRPIGPGRALVAQAPLQVNTTMTDRRPFSNSSVPEPSSEYAPDNSVRTDSHRRQVLESIRQYEEPIPATSRTSAVRGTSQAMPNDQSKDRTPERSPLQKLEVTLKDITKEEKRARVAEAETLLRQSKSNSRGRTTSRDTTSKSAATPAKQNFLRGAPNSDMLRGQDHVNSVHSVTTVQPDHVQNQPATNFYTPNGNRFSANGRSSFEYNGQDPDSRRRLAKDLYKNGVGEGYPRPSSQRESEGQRRSLGTNIPSEPSQIPNNTYVTPRQASHDAVLGDESTRHSLETSSRLPEQSPEWHPGPQSSAASVPSNITRAVSMQSGRPPAQFRDERDMKRSGSLSKDTNSSHKAALTAGAVAGGAAAAIGNTSSRTGSKKLQKAPPTGYDGKKPPQGNRRFSFESGGENPERSTIKHPPTTRYAQELPVEPSSREIYASQTQRPPRPDEARPFRLGLEQTPRTSGNFDTTLSSPQAQRLRHASVSFKEPFARARPTDEWKSASVARLAQEDFILESALRTSQNRAWRESQNSVSTQQRSKRGSSARDSAGTTNFTAIDEKRATFNPPLLLKCGPLLRYTGMKKARSDASTPSSHADHAIWRGSVMIVTVDSHSSYERVPSLRLYSKPKRTLRPPPHVNEGQELAPEFIDPIAGLTKLSRTGSPLYVRPVDHLEQARDLSRVENDDGLFEHSPSPVEIRADSSATAAESSRTSEPDGQSLDRYQEVAGARLYADPGRGVTFWRFNLEIELGQEQAHVAYRINNGASVGFWVPSRDQSMNLMFHSCNGFSMSVDPDAFGGPDPLWRDVLNNHQSTPFHAMIGGGDQIYNDRVAVDTEHFGAWTRLKNPEHKHHVPFTAEIKEELETFYLERYCMWFSQGLFGMANSQIPMINIWDDHDIIDGFGSYPHHFMCNPVFSGLGNVAFKYYMLFQHQSVPEEKTADEPSWVLGPKPGPYITQQSRSIFLSLGKHVAFLGLDCRTERRRDEVLSEATMDAVLERCRKELIEGETRHLIVLLGVPVAYPRLVWLETLLTSRAMDPVKYLGRAGIVKGGFLNKFDGGVELLDDLDDHWTAKSHKHERNYLIEDLQDLAAERSVRITILGGDVHLAAVGQFYSNPKLRIPKDRDHRYMPNIISSAVVNTPPSDMVADVLNKRNKVHHLNRYTDEQMVPLFTHDPLDKRRNNKHLLPKRNWCSIREYLPGFTPLPTPPDTPSSPESELGEEDEPYQRPPQHRFSFSRSREALTPRSLMRRISSRGAPPSAYRNDSDYHSQDPVHPVDPSCPVHGQNGDSSHPVPRRRPSADSTQFSQRPSNMDHNSSGMLQRPGFFRRPTNFSEKAARKGNVLAVNPDGTEFDVNDHVNLEGGLDVVINCEVHQGDVAGITAPYRLLIPALWYDGSSDREKLDDAVGMHRKPTLLSRFGSRNRRQEPHDEDYGEEHKEMRGLDHHNGSDDHSRKPRGILGLFTGSRRHQRDGDDFDDESDQDDGHKQQSEELYDTENRPPPSREMQPRSQPQPQFQPPQGHFRPQRQSTTGSRQSYVIGSQSGPQRQASRPQPQSPSITSQSPPPTRANQPDDSYHQPQRQSKQARLLGTTDDSLADQRDGSHRHPKRLSKQAQLLGLSDDIPYMTPGQLPLTGDGIIGRNVSNQYSVNSQDSNDQQRSLHSAQGYSDVSAYRTPKPQRRWSLRTMRERARLGTKYEYND